MVKEKHGQKVKECAMAFEHWATEINEVEPVFPDINEVKRSIDAMAA